MFIVSFFSGYIDGKLRSIDMYRIASNLMHAHFNKCPLTQIQYHLQQGLQTIKLMVSLFKSTSQKDKKRYC